MKCKPEQSVCHDCGVLKCMCRPRFFAGQLLTEQDLNRLDTYIRDKNRLHTLQLHGSGVVNGLEVTCDSCGKGVLVGCGYAISPCGDDIVVCETVAVDICALIKKCRQPEPDCQPYRGAADGCDDLIEEWVLAIRYAEKPSRGVTALRMGTCGCGKPSGTCGCSRSTRPCTCGAGSVTSSACRCQDTATQQKPRGAPAECEPTVICEGYSFDVFRAPKAAQRGQDPELVGPLVERFYCCIQALLEAIPAPPFAPNYDNYLKQQDKWHVWCCQTKAELLAYLSVTPGVDCRAIADLQMVACPVPQKTLFPQADLPDTTFALAMDGVFQIFTKVVVDSLLACLCGALLPPCPAPAPDDRIPLAVVRVRRRDCAVLSVCNWTPLRHTVLTAPNILYWLSLLPWMKSPKDILHTICCGLKDRSVETSERSVPKDLAGPPLRQAASSAHETVMSKLNAIVSSDVTTDNRVFSKILFDAADRAEQAFDPNVLVTSLFGLPASGMLSVEERANLPQFLMLNQVLRPVLASLFRPGAVAGFAAKMLGKVTPGATADEVAAMRTEIDELKAQFASLQPPLSPT